MPKKKGHLTLHIPFVATNNSRHHYDHQQSRPWGASTHPYMQNNTNFSFSSLSLGSVPCQHLHHGGHLYEYQKLEIFTNTAKIKNFCFQSQHMKSIRVATENITMAILG
jgi:hypothetical protein